MCLAQGPQRSNAGEARTPFLPCNAAFVCDVDQTLHCLLTEWFVCWIWFFTSQSTIFQLCRDRSPWVEPVLSKDTYRIKLLTYRIVLSGLQIRDRFLKIIFLFLNQNICCGYSKEPSQWDAILGAQTILIWTYGSMEQDKQIWKNDKYHSTPLKLEMGSFYW